jgi:hypothetical protein
MLEDLKQTSRKLFEEAFFSGSVTTLDTVIASIGAIKNRGELGADMIMSILNDIKTDHQNKLEKAKCGS